MKFVPESKAALRSLLISISIGAILLAGLQVKQFSSLTPNDDTLQEITIGDNSVAILPFAYKTLSVDFYSLPEVLLFKKGALDLSINTVLSSVNNTYCRNVYFVFTRIHAP